MLLQSVQNFRGIVSGMLVFAVLFAVPTGPAMGQGLFDFLFGAPSAPAQKGAERPNGFVASQDREKRARLSTYRTVCVRLCDGYFFPINHKTKRSQFDADEDLCHARCDGDVRLFYMPSSTSRIEDAYDRRGRAYKRIKNAFLYRRKLVKGCGCKPKPWSEAARRRHRRYAIKEALAQGDKKLAMALGFKEPVAANAFAQKGPNGEPLVVQEPVPVPREVTVAGVAAPAPALRRKPVRRRRKGRHAVKRKKVSVAKAKPDGWGFNGLLKRTSYHKKWIGKRD